MNFGVSYLRYVGTVGGTTPYPLSVIRGPALSLSAMSAFTHLTTLVTFMLVQDPE